MKYLSMFSGVGGFEKGIEDAETDRQTCGCDKDWGELQGKEWECERGYVHPESQQNEIYTNKWQCIGYSEIDKYASAIYKYHYPNHINYGDARAIDPAGIPELDLIVGGFPCQSFSIAGKRGGFEDTRGTLFFEIARIARVKRPGYLFLENVKGLLNHDEGNTFATIITTLDELGYDYQWQVLNSKYHGVPQNRERVFIIANLRGIRRPQIFPFGETGGTYPEGDGESIANCIDSNCHKGWLDHGQRTMVIHQNKSGCVTKHDEAMALRSGASHNYQTLETARTVRSGGQGSPIDSKQCWDTYRVNGSIRRLTPIECERLQGFPDNWTQYGMFEDGVKEISDTQRYKCMGNAVTTNVIRDIVAKWIK